MCVREGSKSRGCATTGLLEARVQGYGAQKGIILSVAAKEHPHTPFLFVARNCCITSQNEERKQLRPLGSATWVISNPAQTCQTDFSTEQEVCGFHRNISMPKPRTSAWLSILANGFAHWSSVKHGSFTHRPNRPALLTVTHHRSRMSTFSQFQDYMPSSPRALTLKTCTFIYFLLFIIFLLF